MAGKRRFALHLHTAAQGCQDPLLERHYRSVRQFPALTSPIHLCPRRILGQTRFRADRDAEIMTAYAKTICPTDGVPPLVIGFSVETDRTDLIRAWEHATPGFEQRLEAITTLRQAGLCVVATLSPFGLWNDLTGTRAHLKTLEVAYITILFFKENTTSANTPRSFLAYLRAEHPQLLDSRWQAERLAEVQAVFGVEHVLVGQAGLPPWRLHNK